MGPRLFFYNASLNQDNSVTIEPCEIKCDEKNVNDTAPVERWDCNVLEPKGAENLHTVVESITQGYQALITSHITASAREK